MGCKAITPELVSLAARLEGKPFHLLAAHRQRNPREEVVEYVRSQGLPPDTPNVTVTSMGGHPQVKGNGYVPYYFVFDHTGRMVHHHMCGNYHGGDGLKMIEWVDRLLEDAPAIWLGEEPFTTHAGLAERIASGKGLAKAVAELENLRGEGADGAPELDRLHAALVRHRDRRLAAAEHALGSRPSTVVERLEDLAKELGDTELGAPVAARLVALDGSDDLKRAIQVEKELAKLEKRMEKWKPCKSCKRAGAKGFRANCTECCDQNAKSLASFRRKLEELAAEADGLPIARAVERLAP